jgi:predicted ATPase
LASPPPPLIGRKKELLDVLRLFRRDGVRLVTITGVEGVGKTRFAHEVAAELGVIVVDDAVAAEVRAAAPVVATSRERLGLAGEREYRLRPLAEAPAVELFRQRASAINPSFDESYEDVAAVCARLGRLPRAIEQAAARGSLD